MSKLPQEETLADLQLRHAHLITEHYTHLHSRGAYALQPVRLLNQLTSLQVELLRFHRQSAPAMQLSAQLRALEEEALPASDLFQRLLALLQPAA